jgi:transmembrane sensor
MPDLRYAAAGWVLKLQDPEASDADLLAFDKWLEASSEHRRAYDQALDAWLELDKLSAVASAAPSQPRRARRRPRQAARFGREAPWLASAAAAAAVVIVLNLWPGSTAEPPGVLYSTAKGERRVLRLSDGTRVDLNAATRISVQLGRKARQVTLVEGEAAFNVAHDQGRPFTVATKGGLVRDIGTEFDVRQRGGALSVTVSRGVVQLEPAGELAGKPVRLTAGQRLERTGGMTAQVRTIAPDDDFSWRRGELVLRNQSLGAVVEELNFYFPRPIRIEDSKLAARAVSGVLRLDDQSTTLRRLTLFAPVKVIPRDADVLLEPTEPANQ